MKIRYLHKTTLIDYPGKIAATLFLSGCNFRCGFCHNPELVLPEDDVASVTEDTVLSFLKKRKEQLEGVCFTGGEPLLSLSLDFLKKIKALGYAIKIDTNGCYPERLRECMEDGLVDYVAMDIKASPRSYASVVGRENVPLEKIEESIALVTKELDSYELRTTVVDRFHSDQDIKAMIEWVVDSANTKIRRFILQGFKYRGKVLDASFASEKDTSEDTLKRLQEIIKPYAETVEYRD
jgi:anaerobic ribonucleoside-triphosphate reductase activating protein